MNFEIRDKKLLLDIIQASIDHHFYNKAKKQIIFAKVPSDIIDRNFGPIFKEKKISPRVKDAWISAFPIGQDSISGHKHVDEVWVYYLNTPENCGELILDKQTTITPHEGDLVIIPKGTNHQVTENKSDGYRISLAMELVIGK